MVNPCHSWSISVFGPSMKEELDTLLNGVPLPEPMGRESIHELGRRGPYHRFVSFPVDIITEFIVGDNNP